MLHNLRNTKQKQIIKEAILSLNHPTMDDIILAAKKLDSKLSLATIYRNIKQMVYNNELLVVSTKNNYYDINTFEHEHFLCNKCNKLYDIDTNFNVFTKKELENCKHKIEGHSLILSGICETCLKKDE